MALEPSLAFLFSGVVVDEGRRKYRREVNRGAMDLSPYIYINPTPTKLCPQMYQWHLVYVHGICICIYAETF